MKHCATKISYATLVILMLGLVPVSSSAQSYDLMTPTPLRTGNPCSELPGEGEGEVNAQIQDFWLRAWGETFAKDESVLLIRATNAERVWDVLKGDKTSGVVGQGSFTEEARYSVDITSMIDPAILEAAELEHYERRIVAGVFTGSTGEALYVHGVVTDAGNKLVDEAGLPVSNLVVLATSETLRQAKKAAKKLAALYSAAALDVAKSQTPGLFEALPEGSSCTNHCVEDRNSARFLCRVVEGACLATVAAGTAACILACGPAAPLCAGFCISAGVAAEVVCLAQGDQCEQSAENQYFSCLSGCTCIGPC